MRNALIVPLLALLAVASTGCQLRNSKKQPVAQPVVAKDYNKPLGVGEQALVEIDIKELPNFSLANEERANLQSAIQRSLAYLNSPSVIPSSA